MNFVDFPEANFTFLKPSDMKEEECGSLRVYRREVRIQEGLVRENISCWQPSEDDKKRILEGKPIWLHIFGSGHPPVMVTTINPFPPKLEVVREE